MKNFMWFLLPFAVAFGAGFYFLSNYQNQKSPAVSPVAQQSSVQSLGELFKDPPSQSLKGQITSSIGDVTYQARTATESAKLTDASKPVIQGESYETEDSGKLSILFPGVVSVSLAPKSKLNFAQTLPQNVVIVQSSGNIDYQQLGADIVTIRAAGLLLKEQAAEVKVEMDSDANTVMATIISGLATAAWDDLNQASHIVNISKGKKIIFYTDSRTIQII